MRKKLVPLLVAFAMLVGILPQAPSGPFKTQAAKAQAAGCYFVTRSFDGGLYFRGEFLTFKPTDAPNGYVQAVVNTCPSNAVGPTPAPGQPTPVPTGTNGNASPSPSPSASSSGLTPTPAPTQTSAPSGGGLTGISDYYFCGSPENPFPTGSDLSFCPAAYVQLVNGKAYFTTMGFTSRAFVYPSVDNDFGNYVQVLYPPNAAAPTAAGFSIGSFSFGGGTTLNTSDNSVVKLIVFGTGTVNVPTPAPTASAAPTPSPVPTYGPVTVQSSSLQMTSQDQLTLSVSQSGNTAQNFSVGVDFSSIVAATYSAGGVSLVAGNPGLATVTVTSGLDGQKATVLVTVNAGAITITPANQTVVVGGPSISYTINQPDGGTLNTYSLSGFTSNNLVCTVTNRTTINCNAPFGATIGMQHVTVQSSDGAMASFGLGIVAANPLIVQPTSLQLFTNASGNINLSQTGNTAGYSAYSNNPSVAQVNILGSVVQVIAQSAAGATSVVITGADQLQQTVPVTVATPAAGAIVLSPASLAVVAGVNANNTSVIAQSGTGLTYSHSGEDPTIATVAISGHTITVTGLKIGTTTSTIASSDGVTTAPLAISVSNGAVSFATNPLVLTMPTTLTDQIIQPGTATNNTYTLSGYDNTMITPTVSSSGLLSIVPLKTGMTQLTVQTYGNQTGTLQVQVQNGTISVSPAALTATVGGGNVSGTIAQVGTTTGSYMPSGYSQSILSIVGLVSGSITNNTLTITPLSPGQTTITLTSTGGKSVQVVVTVNPAPPLVLSPTQTNLIIGNTTPAAFSATQQQSGTPAFSVVSGPTSSIATLTQSGTTGAFSLLPGTVAGTTQAIIAGIDGVQSTETIVTSTPAPIVASPNPLNLANGATGTVNATQGNNTSFSTSISSGTAAATVGAQSTNNGVISVTGTSAGGTANLHIVGQYGKTLDVPVNAGTPPPSGASPYPITAQTTSSSSQELTLKSLNPSALYPSKEGSGTTLTDTSGNGLNGTYGSAVTWASALTTAPSAANFAPIYPSPTTTDAAGNYSTVADNALLQPTLAITLHLRFNAVSTIQGTWLLTYGYQGGGPYVIDGNGSGGIACVFRGKNSAGTGEAITVNSPTAVTLNANTDLMCGTDGTNAYMTINGQLVAPVTTVTGTGVMVGLNYTYSTTRGLTIGSDPGAAATYTAPLNANFPGAISEVAIYPTYIPPPSSTTDYNAAACSIENAALGNVAGTACSISSGNPPPPAALSLTPTSLSFASGGPAQSFTATQTGGTFSISSQTNSACTTITPNGATFSVTPVGTAACTNVVTIAGASNQIATESISVAAASGAPPITLQDSGGNNVTSATFTAGGAAQVFTIVQTGYTSGFVIPSGSGPNTNCASAYIGTGSSANKLYVTPVSSLTSTCTTSLTVNGNGSVSLLIDMAIGKQG